MNKPTQHDADQIRADKEARAMPESELFAMLKKQVEERRPDLFKRKPKPPAKPSP